MKNNYRYAGVKGACCGICVFNQCSNEAQDICERGTIGIYDDMAENFVCDLFEIQPDSVMLSDLASGTVVERDIDEPYRGNSYSGPYEVAEVWSNGFTYNSGKAGKKVKVFAPLRGYKIISK